MVPLFQPTPAPQNLLADLVRETGRSSQPIFSFGGTRVAPALEVVIGRDTIELLPTISSEEAIACVEQHLRGGKDHAARDTDEPSFSARQANFELSTDLLAARAA